MTVRTFSFLMLSLTTASGTAFADAGSDYCGSDANDPFGFSSSSSSTSYSSYPSYSTGSSSSQNSALGAVVGNMPGDVSCLSILGCAPSVFTDFNVYDNSMYQSELDWYMTTYYYPSNGYGGYEASLWGW